MRRGRRDMIRYQRLILLQLSHSLSANEEGGTLRRMTRSGNSQRVS